MEFYPAISVMKVVSDESLAKDATNTNFTSPRMDNAMGHTTLQMANNVDELVTSANNNTAMSTKAKESVREAILTICIDEDKKKQLLKLKRIPLCTEAMKGCDVNIHPDIIHLLWAYVREVMKDQGFVVGSRFGFIGRSNPVDNLSFPYNTVTFDMEGNETEYVGETLNKQSKEISTNRDIRRKLEGLVHKNR